MLKVPVLVVLVVLVLVHLFRVVVHRRSIMMMVPYYRRVIVPWVRADHHAGHTNSDMDVDIGFSSRGEQAGGQRKPKNQHSFHGEPLFQSYGLLCLMIRFTIVGAYA